jgi:hypothetical protein
MNQIKDNLIDQQDFKTNVLEIINKCESQEMKYFLLKYNKKKIVNDLLLQKTLFNADTTNSELNCVNTLINSLEISGVIYISCYYKTYW